MKIMYHIVGMFGMVNVWQIAELNGGKKLGEWVNFSHKDAIDKLKLRCFMFCQPQMICQICQIFPLPTIPAIQCLQL